MSCTLDPTIPNLRQRISMAREHAGMTQKELAEKVKCSQPAINKLESGKIKASSHLFAIATACHVDPIWLVTGTGTMVPESTPTPTNAHKNQIRKLASQLDNMAQQIEKVIQDLTEFKKQLGHLQADLADP